ncbi:Uncharacterised protein [Mycobacteroides abscessus subsp. abscessus]|nr:Uncharacterised protein [Mycobacteroides abscessus subsp. abscessus]
MCSQARHCWWRVIASVIMIDRCTVSTTRFTTPSAAPSFSALPTALVMLSSRSVRGRPRRSSSTLRRRGWVSVRVAAARSTRVGGLPGISSPAAATPSAARSPAT